MRLFVLADGKAIDSIDTKKKEGREAYHRLKHLAGIQFRTKKGKILTTKRKQGRPTKEVKRDKIKTVRFTSKELEEIQAAADRVGMKLTEFIRNAATSEAERIAIDIV